MTVAHGTEADPAGTPGRSPLAAILAASSSIVSLVARGIGRRRFRLAALLIVAAAKFLLDIIIRPDELYVLTGMLR